MTGRARGRARGRGQQQQQQPPTSTPAASATATPATSGGGQPGRGRSRGQPQGQPQAPGPRQQQQPPPQRPGTQQSTPDPAVQQATQQVAAVRLDERPSDGGQKAAPQEGERRERRGLTKVGDADPNAGPVTEAMQGGGRVTTGTAGQPLTIVSNFFKLTKTPENVGLFQYNVSFIPELNSGKLKSALLHELDDQIGKTRCFDGMTMFLPKKLELPITEVCVKTRGRKNEDGTTKEGEDIKIRIMFTNEVPANSPSVVQLLNIQFRRQLKHMDMQLVGRNYYNPAMKIDIPAHKMTIWPGFSTSILQYEKSVMLCADVSHKVLRKQTVLEALYDLYNKVGAERFYAEATKSLVGEIVLTRYNNKTYRIDDINWDARPENKFPKEDGSEISYKQYLFDRYNVEVKDMAQPMLISKPKAKDQKRGMTGNIILLPEFCAITGLSDELRANFSVMKDLAEHTRVSPASRVNTLEKFMNDMSTNQLAKQEMIGWNMSFDKKLVSMQGRAFAPEPMFQKNDRISYKQADADWSKETRGKELIAAVNLQKWILFCGPRDQQVASNFLQTLKRVCPPMGMQVADPKLVKLDNDDAKHYAMALKENIKAPGSAGCQIVVCIVSNNKKDRYDAIKKVCCVENPMPSQVLVQRTLSKEKMLMSVCTKVGIQLNCKLGGEVWGTEIPLKSLMVVGLDVYHDSLTKGKSITGFVASMNKNLTRYFSTVIEQRSHQELTDKINLNLVASLKKWLEINKELPQTIIIYRDGVGDGQLREVMNDEVRQVDSAIASLNATQGGAYKPKKAFIVVKKRISTRLFAQSGNGQCSNPPPGTVVDTEVTRPEWYDFFLVSQAVRQGTVSPTHYNVICDNTALKPDHFQRLTYKLCHLYYNWPGTIRVPAPCQYAHKLASLVGDSVHQAPASVLEDRLYYL